MKQLLKVSLKSVHEVLVNSTLKKPIQALEIMLKNVTIELEV